VHYDRNRRRLALTAAEAFAGGENLLQRFSRMPGKMCVWMNSTAEQVLMTETKGLREIAGGVMAGVASVATRVAAILGVPEAWLCG
jgi:hypothetical protein